jgi:hypothetical protein
VSVPARRNPTVKISIVLGVLIEPEHSQTQ